MTCCPTRLTVADSDYVSLTLPIYEAGDYKSKTAIIFFPDIFGLTSQAKQVADTLAATTSTRVLLVDFFNGKPWPKEKFPVKPEDDLYGWIKGFNYDTFVKPTVEKQIEKLRFQGVTTFHAIGFCWGGRQALNLQQNGLVELIATCHSAFLSDDDANDIKGPQCHLLSQDEEPLLGLKAGLEASPFAAQSHFERFDTVPHGWLGARMNRNDPEIKKEADRGLEILARFFNGKL